MSYALQLFLPIKGESPLDLARRDEADFDRAISPASKIRNATAVSKLLEFNSRLDVNEGDGFVQILDPNDGTGIIVELNDTTGAITVPYWHDHEAEKVLALLTSYLRIVHESAGFCAYDPQTGELVDPMAGIVKAPYLDGVRALEAIATKPWWKFWK